MEEQDYSPQNILCIADSTAQPGYIYQCHRQASHIFEACDAYFHWQSGFKDVQCLTVALIIVAWSGLVINLIMTYM